jgi:hypothetical protein
MSVSGGKADTACCTASAGLVFGNLETGAYSECSAFGCKNLQPCISRKSAKFSRHFKGHFRIGNVRVRILPGQPASPAPAEFTHRNLKNARQLRAFAIKWTVSGLPIWQIEGLKRRKSLAACRNIPVFGRPALETRFDQHRVTGLAVQPTKFSAKVASKLGNTEFALFASSRWFLVRIGPANRRVLPGRPLSRRDSYPSSLVAV